MRWTSRRGVLTCSIDGIEAEVLSSLLEELLTLLGAGQDPDPDPLAALVGLSSGRVDPPKDPALARLLPAAYDDDEPEAAAEFRRFTEADLRAGKRSAATTVLAALEPLRAGGGRLPVDRDAADAWLLALNDLRLVLGTRLEVSEDDDEPEPDDAQAQPRQIYSWLGWVQESLLGRLEPRGP